MDHKKGVGWINDKRALSFQEAHVGELCGKSHVFQ